MLDLPIPNPITVDIYGAKITGIRTHRITIFDAWKEKGVTIPKPLAKFEPPKNIESIIKLGVAQSMLKNLEAEGAGSAKAKEIINEANLRSVLLSKPNIGNNLFPATPLGGGALMGINTGGEMLSWGDVGNWLSGVGQSIENAVGSAGNALSNAGGAIVNGAEQVGSGISNFVGQIGKVWDGLVHLADLVNEMYSFMKEWKSKTNTLLDNMLNIQSINKNLTKVANDMIIENRKIFAQVEEAMHKSLAEYFDNLVYNMMKYGAVDVPTGVVGFVNLQIKNNTAMPMSVAVPDLVIKSGPYILHKGTYFVNMLPFEGDEAKIPIEVTDVESAKYLLDYKKAGKAVPISVMGTVITPAKKFSIVLNKNVLM